MEYDIKKKTKKNKMPRKKKVFRIIYPFKRKKIFWPYAIICLQQHNNRWQRLLPCFVSRPVSRITIRTLTKVRREDHEKCNSKGISNKVRVLDEVQRDFEKDLSNRLNEIFQSINILYDTGKLVANEIKKRERYEGTTMSKEV